MLRAAPLAKRRTSAAAIAGHHAASGAERQLSRIYLSQQRCQIKHESLKLLVTRGVNSAP